MEILRLGGLPWWELSRSDALFVDARALPEDLRRHVLEWSSSQELVDFIEAYEVTMPVDEAETTTSFFCWTKQEANAEMEEGGQIKFVPRLPILSAQGALRAKQNRSQIQVADDFLMQFWVQDVVSQQLPQVVGVWYGERLDPYLHSAPRIAIFPDQLDSFDRREIARSAVPDDEEMLCEVPETQWLTLQVDEPPRPRLRVRG
jgi:hypothetical protein